MAAQSATRAMRAADSVKFGDQRLQSGWKRQYSQEAPKEPIRRTHEPL